MQMQVLRDLQAKRRLEGDGARTRCEDETGDASNTRQICSMDAQ